MANKKEEAGGGAPGERQAQSAAPEQQGAPDPRSAERASQRAQRSAEEAASRTAEAGRQATEQSTRQATQAMEQATRQATQMTEQSTRQATRMADRSLRQAADMARQQTEGARNLLAASSEAYRDLTEYSRADLDAMLQSSVRLARGWQEMSWEMTQFTQQSVRLSMRLANDMLECRTVEDVVAVQRDFFKESVDAFLAESARLLTMSSRMASDAVTPITERVGDGAAETGAPEERGGAMPAPPRHEGSGRDVRH